MFGFTEHMMMPIDVLETRARSVGLVGVFSADLSGVYRTCVVICSLHQRFLFLLYVRASDDSSDDLETRSRGVELVGVFSADLSGVLPNMCCDPLFTPTSVGYCWCVLLVLSGYSELYLLSGRGSPSIVAIPWFGMFMTSSVPGLLPSSV